MTAVIDQMNDRVCKKSKKKNRDPFICAIILSSMLPDENNLLQNMDIFNNVYILVINIL